MRLSPLRLTAAAGATAAVLAVSPSALAADAVYGGTTRSGDAFVVKADSGAARLRSLVVTWDVACDNGKRLLNWGEVAAATPTPGFSPNPDELLVARNAKGRFKGTQIGAIDLGGAVAAVQVQIEGKLGPKRATGTLSVIAKVSDKGTGSAVASCQTGTQRWIATRAPGIIYGGATSQGEPLVVRLNAQRKRVNDLLFTWRAPCTPSGGFFRFPEHFGNFAVQSRGGFGGPVSADFPMDAGGKRRYEYTVAGRVTRTAAKGTLQVKVAETDVNGAATDSCTTGGMTWKAATG